MSFVSASFVVVVYVFVVVVVVVVVVAVVVLDKRLEFRQFDRLIVNSFVKLFNF